MADIAITNNLDAPVKPVDANLQHPGSLFKYLKSQALHFAVVPDFLALKDKPLPEAARTPVVFSGHGQHEFTLGADGPEVHVRPGASMTVRLNGESGADLFADDPFRVPARVPDGVAYAAAGFEGSLTLGVSGSKGDLSFGLDQNGTVQFEYWKAFAAEAPARSVIDALADTLAGFVIPGNISDLDQMEAGDIATVSGTGSLKISAGMRASISPNPLASVNLPMSVGTVAVQAGATAALDFEFLVSGAYQIRLRRRSASIFELSFLQADGQSMKTDLSGGLGLSANFGDNDLLVQLLRAVSTDPTSEEGMLADLRPEEAQPLAQEIKDGLNHSLKVSLDAVLSASRTEQALFQYEIEPALLTDPVKQAINGALDGDLTLLTRLGNGEHTGGVVAAGLRVLNSVTTQTQERGLAMRLNLLGVVNLLNVSTLLQQCEVFRDGASGDVIITDKATAVVISAESEPMRRQAALRSAMYDATRLTTSYLCSGIVSVPKLACEQVHFVTKADTDKKQLAAYLTWFMPLNLLTRAERNSMVAAFHEAERSDCVLRISYGASDCESMFVNGNATPRGPRTKDEYLDIARQALLSVLNAEFDETDALRARLLSDPLWRQAVALGPVQDLAKLVGLSVTDHRVQLLEGDIYDIAQWADSMVRASAALTEMYTFLGGRNPAALVGNREFEQRRERLQHETAEAVKASRPRFDGPFGLVAMYWAAGSPRSAQAKIAAGALTIQRSSEKAVGNV